MKRFRQRKAFTIVEMVIVIAVIAILATVLVPTISGVIQKANHSADQQFVASLNVQLALWPFEKENGGKEITSEADLREAINYYYGEKDENGEYTGDGDFYAKLSPKSAPQGYHYWWNATDKTMVLAKYEDLLPKPEEISLIDEEESKLTFSPASPRSLLINEKNYFLMDQAGSDIAVAMQQLVECTDANYTTAVHSLENMEDALGAAVLAKVQDTAILNDNGMYVCGTNAVSYIYIPEGTQSLNAPAVSVYSNGALTSGSLTFDDILSDDTLIDVPAGIKLYTRGAAFGEGITIFMNATLEEIKANGLIHAESTNCTIKLPDGNEYTVSGKKLMQDGSAVYSELPYTVPVAYVTVTLNNSFTAGNVKANITQNKLSSTTDGQLYIAYDYAGDLAFTYEAFDASGNPIPDAVTVSDSYAGWSEKAEAANTYTAIADNDDINGALTVTVQGEDFDVNIDRVVIKALTVTTIGGKNPADYFVSADATNAAYTAVYQLGFTSGSTFGVVAIPTVSDFYTDADGVRHYYVDVDQTVEMDTNSYVEYNKTTGNLSVKSGVTNQRTTATFRCGENGVAACELNLVDNTNSPFKPAATATSAYMPSGIVYFGTSNAYLSQLFAVNDGVNIADQLVTYSFSINDWDSPTYKAADWANTAMTFGNFTGIKENVTVTIGVGGKTAEVTVHLVKGAKNVAKASDWTSVSNQDLVLLTDLKNFADGTSCITVTNGTVYGNLHKISWDDGTYYVYKQANNAIITLNNGVIDNLVIDGPNYSTTSLWSDAATKGVYVFGVYVNGTATINNSYISGFMAPVGAKTSGKTINLNSTVLKGGAMGNIYVNESSMTLNITNCTMIRNFEGNLAAPGIYLDEKATSTGINMSGTAQHTFATVDQATTLPGVSSLGGLADTVVGLINGSVGMHRVGTTEYLHMGVLMHASATVNGWSNDNTYSINGVTYKYTQQSIGSLGAKACVQLADTPITGCSKCANGGWHLIHNNDLITGWNDNCSMCDNSSGTHSLTPSWGSSATDYLNHRK